MPGILGLIGKRASDKRRRDLEAMARSMLHESFYSHGKHMNEEDGVYAAWVCHKGSFCDCMPVWNEKRNVMLVFFGEDFSDADALDSSQSKHKGLDRVNASYLVHLYEDKGIDFLQDLNGWFSGLLIDLQLNRTFLFNDRYGMQKVFYHEGADCFYFASEAKAILEVCPELRQLSMRGAGELLSCGCVLDDRTLFDGISLLPAGSVWMFQNGTITKQHFFDPSTWENQPVIEKEVFYEALRETFRSVLPRYFRSNQQVGISLTGGLDTRMIMANMPNGNYPCFSFRGPYRDCYDVTVARKIAKTCGQTHETILLNSDFLSDFPTYAEKTIWITDGYLDISGSPEVFVNRAVRDIAQVRLTGNFGGEVLRAIRHLRAAPINQDIFEPEFYAKIRDAKQTLGGIRRNTPLSFILFNDAPWHNNNRLVAEQSQLTLRTPYLDNDLTKLMYRAPKEATATEEISLRLISDGNRELGAILTDRGIGTSKSFLSALVHQYREFLFRAEYAYNYGMPQWLSRFDHIFKFMHFERLFLGRHKFYHFRIWYRDHLAEYVRAILLDQRTLDRPYLNREAVAKIVTEHTKGYRNYTTEITQLLTFELIQRLLIERK